jgi:hypothetical protein
VSLVNIDYHRLVLTLDDERLERFTRDWVSLRKSDYLEVQPFSGPQDLGRDVVGFLTHSRHEGAWHNYQCKQYTRQRLPVGEGLKELGKVLYHASRSEFTPPAKYYFVAPHGISRPLEKLIDKPSRLREALLTYWDKYCATKIIKGKTTTLDAPLTSVIAAFDFSSVTRITLAEMLAAEGVSLVLHRHFGADPGPAPVGVVPADVQPMEYSYIGELITAYGERDGVVYKCPADVPGERSHGRHLISQRERFFDADSFKRFYRDNTAPETLPRLERDVEHGIADVHGKAYPDTLGRIEGVMAQAATIRPGGPLAEHAGITVKQGMCHHLVNDGKLSWRKA